MSYNNSKKCDACKRINVLGFYQMRWPLLNQHIRSGLV
jgi:hypothetical protein